MYPRHLEVCASIVGFPDMAKPRIPPIEERIREAFQDYSDTLALVREYAARRQHPVELGILVCARLDSLANLAGLGRTQSERSAPRPRSRGCRTCTNATMRTCGNASPPGP